MKGAKTLEFCVDKELIDNHSMNVVINMVRNEISEKKIDLKNLHKEYVFSFQRKEAIPASSASFEDLLFNAKINIKYNSARIEKMIKKN
jgi:ABC-type phosphate transport system ATPase subunit